MKKLISKLKSMTVNWKKITQNFTEVLAETTSWSNQFRDCFDAVHPDHPYSKLTFQSHNTHQNLRS